MTLDRFQKAWGVGKRLGSTMLLALGVQLSSSRAMAQSLDPLLGPLDDDLDAMLDVMPPLIAVGAIGFGIAAVLWLKRARRKKSGQAPNPDENAHMRAKLDQYETLLAGLPEVSLLWTQGNPEPSLFGPVEQLGPGRNDRGAILGFSDWIIAPDAGLLTSRLSALRAGGESFDLQLQTSDGGTVHAMGRTLGGACALHLRSETALEQKPPVDADGSAPVSTPNAGTAADIKTAETILAMLPKPAWIRDAYSQLIFVNDAYKALARQMGRTIEGKKPVELFSPDQLAGQITALGAGLQPVKMATPLPQAPQFDLVLFPLEAGSAGYLTVSEEGKKASEVADLVHISGVMDALSTPVVIFDAKGKLKQFNAAYCNLWQLDADWLRQGLSERAILDRLRTLGALPSTQNYREWRDDHLSAYQLKAAREESWYLPDGRTINVVAAPALGAGGVIYVFEDVTEQLRLQSTNKSLANVQRETLNALSEGVAVFGTDGRLRLHNPRLSSIWKLPMNQLGQHPHIDEIASECGKVIEKDGARIWGDLKQFVVNLNPNRTDRSGRISRSDGHLIDYAIVRLPDGQTMLTFVDVTRSAQYEHMLKERNEALETADRLKDAFIQNVSYELRSPLTNIIGFADLLASNSFGPLNSQQRQYTDYIRSSSATLGILIDNILDLTHVDAGIAELDLQPQDIKALIEKAKTGLAATLSGVDGNQALDLVVSLPDELPVFVADGARIVQILYNLLSNAAKFSEPGARVQLMVEPRGDWIRFIIEDEGVGVPEEIKGDVFDRFEGRSISGRQRGAGLGLTIVEAFVQLHGGTVIMEQRQPRGARVIVNLPAIASQIVSAPGKKDA